MHTYSTLPSIYLGVGDAAIELHAQILNAQLANKDRFHSMNQFLRHLIDYAIQNDPTLKRKER